MKRNKFKRRLLFLLCISLLAFTFIQSSWISRTLYPISYKQDIVKMAEKYNLEPQLIAAVIRVESNYKLGQASPKGAIGLMQLMPSTAKWAVEKANLEPVTEEQLLHNVQANIELGAWYLRYLVDLYDKELIVALAAYNAGPGNVGKWLSDQTWIGTLDTVHDIPFGETRNYVQKVIYYYNKYKEIYPEM